MKASPWSRPGGAALVLSIGAFHVLGVLALWGSPQLGAGPRSPIHWARVSVVPTPAVAHRAHLEAGRAAGLGQPAAESAEATEVLQPVLPRAAPAKTMGRTPIQGASESMPPPTGFSAAPTVAFAVRAHDGNALSEWRFEPDSEFEGLLVAALDGLRTMSQLPGGETSPATPDGWRCGWVELSQAVPLAQPIWRWSESAQACQAWLDTLPPPP